MIKQATKTRKSQRELTILRRYAISKGNMAGSICNVVHSVKTIKGETIENDYQVWTYRLGRMSCDCPAKTPYCCHIDLVTIEEYRRCDYVAPVKNRRHVQVAQSVGVTVEQVAEITIVAEQAKAEKQAAREQHQAELDAAKVRPNYEVESKRRMAAPLNGKRGFSLCKSWAELEAEKQAGSKVA